jgi:hypothetical protein
MQTNKPQKSSADIWKGMCETYLDCENVGWPRVTVLPMQRSLETEPRHIMSSSAASMVITWPLLSCPITAMVVCCCHFRFLGDRFALQVVVLCSGDNKANLESARRSCHVQHATDCVCGHILMGSHGWMGSRGYRACRRCFHDKKDKKDKAKTQG